MEILDQLILHVEGTFEVGVILELIFNFPLDLLSTLILGKLFIYLAFDKTSSSLGIVLFQFMVMALTKYFGFRSSKLNLNHYFDA